MATSAAEVIRPLRRVEYDQLVALGVFQDATGLGKAFECLAVAFGAESGRNHRVIGLIAALTALKGKNSNPLWGMGKGVVLRKLAF